MKKVGVWFRNLSKTGKVLVISAFSILAFGSVGTLAQPSKDQPIKQPEPAAEIIPAPKPVPVKTSELKTEVVAFQEETKEDPGLEKGKTKIIQEGIDGERTITFEKTTLDGKEIDLQEVKNEITKAPVNRIVAVGTYIAPAPAPRPTPSCDPNYSGCVPIASDVDCAGGSGNGPAYASGPISVIGSDIYGLDRDNDGIACE